jgi:methylenetetrahydrofolate dehydrogenase (NADP+)/methenyltetrahydrofolate cyclohydrolase
VLVGEDPASGVYVRAKGRATEAAGMHGRTHRLPADTPQAALLALVAELNADEAIDGILVQLPLPAHLDERAVIEAIDPAKDVDGFHPLNAGRLAAGLPGLVPCTPLGCLMMLRDVHPSLEGLEALVIGRSAIVGKPMAQLLLAESCTVTVAHARTRDLPSHVARADVVVAAAGRPGLVRGEWVKPGATVIDVGINRLSDGSLTGDVEYAAAAERAGAITPVPGGVGPMTIACLLRNTLVAACRRARLPEPEGD